MLPSEPREEVLPIFIHVECYENAYGGIIQSMDVIHREGLKLLQSWLAQRSLLVLEHIRTIFIQVKCYHNVYGGMIESMDAIHRQLCLGLFFF